MEDGQVPAPDITVYDTCRIFPDYMQALCGQGPLAGVNFRQRGTVGGNAAAPDKNVRIKWAGNIHGEPTYLPVCLTDAQYLINLATLKGHSWGMTLGAKNHFGSIINSDGLRPPQAAGLHENFINNRMVDYSVLTDLMAQREINGKTILWMLDALITPIDETSEINAQNSRWLQPPFNGSYVASLFFSQDPVALDSVGADFLANESIIARYNGNFTNKHGMENYLHESALLPNPPSGTKYADGAGSVSGSLGVHEHWNNVEDKKYGRNLGKNEGIELVKG